MNKPKTMTSSPRVSRNSRIDRNDHLKTSMNMLSERAGKVGRRKIGEVFDLPLENIKVSQQVRENTKDVESLAESIRVEGQRSPIEVYYDENNTFCLLAGERRYRSLELNKQQNAKVILVNAPDDVANRILRQLSENEERQELTPLDRGRAYCQLKEFGLTQKQIAEKVYKSRFTVRRHITLYESPTVIREAFQEGLIGDLHSVDVLASAYTHFPEDLTSFIDSQRKEGTAINRVVAENWIEWRKAQPAQVVTSETKNKEQHEQVVSKEKSRGLIDLPAERKQTSIQQDEPGYSAAKMEDAENDKAESQRAELQTHSSQAVKGSGEQPLSMSNDTTPVGKVLSAHYSQTSDKTNPNNIFIAVTGKLLDGKTKVEGRLVLDKVDQDSSWAWIKLHETDEEIRVKAKTIRVVTVTA